MDAREIVVKHHPSGTVRELTSGANKVFRIINGDTSTVMKVYPVSSRERRERHALEALAPVPGVPHIVGHGTEGEMAWLEMNDAGHWNLANLPKNLEAVEASGAALRGVHSAKVDITNLAAGIDADYVLSHYRSTIERLGRYRRRFGMEQGVLDRALQLEPPLAVWRLAARVGEDAAAAFRSGYGAELPESRYRPWVAYHAAMMMLEAAEVREGRLGDLSYLVDDLTSAVLGS
jgi:hypothetical protein